MYQCGCRVIGIIWRHTLALIIFRNVGGKEKENLKKGVISPGKKYPRKINKKKLAASNSERRTSLSITKARFMKKY